MEATARGEMAMLPPRSNIEAWLFAVNFMIMLTNSLIMPIREALILEGGKLLQTNLMLSSVISSMLGTSLFSLVSSRQGSSATMKVFSFVSLLVCVLTWGSLVFWGQDAGSWVASWFYLYFTFYNMVSMSTFWVVAGDVLSSSCPSSHFIRAFGKFAAGGTLGQLAGSALSTVLSQTLGAVHSLLPVGAFFACTAALMHCLPATSVNKHKNEDAKSQTLYGEVVDNLQLFVHLWSNRLLFLAFLYSSLLSLTLGLFVIERQRVAKMSSMARDDYASLVAIGLTGQGLVQFFFQFFGTATITSMLGSRFSCALAAFGRLLLFSVVLAAQSGWHTRLSAWYSSTTSSVVIFLLVGDTACRVLNQTTSKPLKESLWKFVDSKVKVRAKIIVDVFAHRLGTSAAGILSNLGVLSWKADGHILCGCLFSTFYVYTALSLGSCLELEKVKRE
jgi:MFS family permease